MYVVLMALLAINVSSEVLDGFAIVQDGLQRTIRQTANENEAVYQGMKRQYDSNPVKVKQWYDKALQVREHTDRIFSFIDSLRSGIDSRAGVVKDDMEAVSQVMLSPTTNNGQRLYDMMNDYRTLMLEMVTDTVKRNTINRNLSTDCPQTEDNKDWQHYLFEAMPTAAAITILTKMQNDIRYTEGEVLHSLMTNIDAGDLRVNSLEALVIPESKTIVQGNTFKANIVMAAVDTTQKPKVFIGDREVTLRGNEYVIPCPRTGDYTLRGFLEMTGRNGEQYRRTFAQPYTVVEPTATVSSDLMNVLYSGYDNPVSISVPGVPLSQVTAAIDNGTLTKTAEGRYVAKPIKAGSQAVLTVTASLNGRQQVMAQHTFRVRRLPEPVTFMTTQDDKGNNERFYGGAISRQQLTASNGIEAAIDDGILDVPFRVRSFETVFFDRMGNAVPMASEGASFSEKQRETFRKLARNRRFYISHVIAIGPDGLERKLKTSMEIIVK